MIVQRDVCKCDVCGGEWLSPYPLPKQGDAGVIPARCANRNCRSTKWNGATRQMVQRANDAMRQELSPALTAWAEGTASKPVSVDLSDERIEDAAKRQPRQKPDGAKAKLKRRMAAERETAETLLHLSNVYEQTSQSLNAAMGKGFKGSLPKPQRAGRR